MSTINPKKDSFLELWEKGMKEYKQGNPKFLSRICLKLKTDIQYCELRNLRCWNCANFIVNHGDCDPL